MLNNICDPAIKGLEARHGRKMEFVKVYPEIPLHSSDKLANWLGSVRI